MQFTHTRTGWHAPFQLTFTRILRAFDGETLYSASKPGGKNNRHTSCSCVMIMMLSFCAPPCCNKFKLNFLPCWGLSKPDSYRLHLRHTASVSLWVSHHPRGRFLLLISGIPFLLSWRNVLNSLVACPDPSFCLRGENSIVQIDSMSADCPFRKIKGCLTATDLIIQ